MNRLLQKLKIRWKVETLWQVVAILIVFSLTGMTTLYIRQFLFTWIGVEETTPLLMKAVFWVVTVVPAYQVLFLIYGFVLGQFHFVWNFEKESFRKVKRLFAGTRG